jgi:hypothetical protein
MRIPLHSILEIFTMETNGIQETMVKLTSQDIIRVDSECAVVMSVVTMPGTPGLEGSDKYEYLVFEKV